MCVKYFNRQNWMAQKGVLQEIFSVLTFYSGVNLASIPFGLSNIFKEHLQFWIWAVAIQFLQWGPYQKLWAFHMQCPILPHPVQGKKSMHGKPGDCGDYAMNVPFLICRF